MEANNNTKGILFIMIGMAFFSIQDSLIKYIFEEMYDPKSTWPEKSLKRYSDYLKANFE